ncbi:MAG TPA: FG-GAP-like repeat-containing protein, partial [Gemmatimonadales bacterium]|nr:FG-GAP-like repeat-containing protein [Gemmatimonadales bacterium]
MLLAVTACTHRAQPLSPVPPVSFERLVSPFPVTDSTGRAYALPFVGGFEHPRPQLLDIDGDGRLDLFLQENSGQLELFQQRADGGWQLTTDRYQGLDIGEWYRFVDLDGDGLYDLFTESPLSDIRYYRNVGTRTAARFSVAA